MHQPLSSIRVSQSSPSISVHSRSFVRKRKRWLPLRPKHNDGRNWLALEHDHQFRTAHLFDDAIARHERLPSAGLRRVRLHALGDANAIEHDELALSVAPYPALGLVAHGVLGRQV